MKNMNDPRSDEYKYPEGDMNEAHEPINEANAHLLAAAPELLEACIEALEVLDDCEARGMGKSPTAPILAAAIAKATKGGGEA